MSARATLGVAWIIVNILAFIAFITTSIYSYKVTHPSYYNRYANNGQGGGGYYGGQGGQGGYYGGGEGGYYGEGGGGGGGEYNQMMYNRSPRMKSTSMVFASIWTGVLSIFLGILGGIILGRICTHRVNNTTKLGLGVFIGALVMFANMLLVSAALFGEFQIDTSNGMTYEQQREMGMYGQGQGLQKVSNAFAMLCLFLAVTYSCFGVTLFLFKETIIEEMEMEDHEKDLQQEMYVEHGDGGNPGLQRSYSNIGMQRTSSNVGEGILMQRSLSNIGMQRTSSNVGEGIQLQRSSSNVGEVPMQRTSSNVSEVPMQRTDSNISTGSTDTKTILKNLGARFKRVPENEDLFT